MPDDPSAGVVKTQQIRLLEPIETPSLVVDLDVFTANISQLAAICAETGVELFPHAKTHRTAEYARRQLEHGAAGLTAASVDEAELFADAGATRVVLAYPLVGYDKLVRARALAQRVELTLLVDGVAGATAIGKAFMEAAMTADVLIEIDTGMHRSGVSAAEALALAGAIAVLPGLKVRGVLTHEGTVYRAEDDEDLVARSKAAAAVMTSLGARLRESGHTADIISLGASASVRVVARESGVTQVRPGIYAFNDLGQIALGNATPATCAVRVLATVVSHPEPGRACIDAGSKSLSQDQLPPRGSGLYPGFGLLADLPGWQLYRLSEEHGWLTWVGASDPTPLVIGQQVQVIPNHVCTAFSSLGESVGISEGRVVGRWRTLPRG